MKVALLKRNLQNREPKLSRKGDGIMAVLRTRKKILTVIATMLVVLIGAAITLMVVYAQSFHTIRINYLYTDGTPAHDPYIATFNSETPLDYDVTNPNVSGFEPMSLNDPENDPAALPTGGVSEATTHIETASLQSDMTYSIYYVAGLTHYAARYYLQNIYDDLYTLDRDRTNANQNRLGKTGTAPADLEAEEITGFTSLFHEPDEIAADGSTVFRVYYDRNYYTVNFDLGEGGYGVDPVYAKYESVYRIDEPTRMGYTFLGWARTNADSSDGENASGRRGARSAGDSDWVYIHPDTVVDDDGNYYRNSTDFENGITCDLEDVTVTEAWATATENLIHFEGTQQVPAMNTYYKAIWSAGTSSLSVVFWVENANSELTDTAADFIKPNGDPMTEDEIRAKISENYSALCIRDIYNIKRNGTYTPVVSGMTIDANTIVRTRAFRAVQEGVVSSDSKAREIAITDLFSYSLGYADPANPFNEDPDPTDPNYDPDAVVYKKDPDGHIIDFNDISEGTSKELNGAGDFFEMNTSANSYEPLLISDTEITVRGDGTSRFNVFFRRKRFNLKFYYARQGYTNGVLDPNKISLTNSTKQFNNNSTEKEYLKTTSKNVLEAIAMGSWEQNSAETLPQVKDEYKQLVTEGYDDFTDSHYNGYYRYYYYQLQAKYNEPLTNKWLIDALDTVHRKGSAEAEICYPGSIATEYYNKYYQDRSTSGNYTVKGIYEKLDKGILFTDSARATMKQNNIDYTELHFLISWTNTSYNNGWNSSITRVLHFRYENYVELLPREVEIVENNGTQALLNEGNYTDVRQFTTKVNENGSWVSKTKWYGLSTDHIYETIDSGNQYDPGKDKIKEARKNQTPTQMTGFEIEYYRTTNGLITLDDYNTIVDWSEDTTNYRRCTIKFFYRRREYTLKYRNGNREDESHTRQVMYGAPINSQYIVTENGHEVNEYRYYWPDPEYFDENRRGFFTFDGWYNDPRYDNAFDLDTQTMPADDETLFAKWVPKSIDVIFYDDYDDFYIDRKGDHPEKRVVLGKDGEDNDVTDINVDYGTYVPLMSIPVNDNSEDNPRPKLTPIAEGASFAGWYYIRNRVPVRFEPENVPVTALNEEAVGDNAKLRLFAEWVTKDVAKYKVSYVKDSDGTEIAAPTTGRAYVWKTKTFNAKSGDELYDEYKWTQEGEQDGLNWWPTSNSSSMVIKANNSDDEYKPNKIEFRYIQKEKVHYKVQYLDAATRKPLVEGGDVIKESTHASVTEDARIIPGYIARTATQSLVLTASNNSDPDEQQAEELEYNVITFLYDQNKNEYMYEVEYLTQDLGANTYSVHSSETLTVEKTGDGAVDLSVADLYNKEIPMHIVDSGYTRVSGGTKFTVTNADGVRDTTLNPVADDGTVEITGNDKKTIMIYFNRNSYRYQYQYIDQSAEKEYLENLKTDPENTAGKWNGVLDTFEKDNNENYFTGQVGQEITIDPDKDYTYHNKTTGVNTDYTRITNEDGELNPVNLTIQPENNWNLVKIYYRKDIERELQYKMVCVNDNPDTDYYADGTPKFGRLNFTIQTVQDYNGIKSNTFYDTNNETIDDTNPSHPEYLHLHRYTFLGWYTTPTYDPEHPETNRITTNETLTKEDLPTGTDLPGNRTKYYALVEQDMVTMDVMFYYTDDYTVSSFRAAEDDTLATNIQNAVNNENNASAADKDKVHLTGERMGKEVTFTAPNGYQNHTKIAWHRNDGYTLSMTDIDEKVYKYKFAEWWEVDERNNNALIRHDNWNSADGWDPDALSQQLSRNRNQYLIAVYARRSITELPYSIDYKYFDRKGVERTYTVKGTLTGDALDENSPNCKITNAGAYELTDEFIMENAPFESNYGQTLCWSDKQFVKTSAVGDSDEGTVDRIITTATAVQGSKKVTANYRLTPDGEYETPIRTTVGANRSSDNRLSNISVGSDTAVNGKYFSYWEVRKSENGNVIAKSYRNTFDLCIMDNYWISPVFSKTASNTKTAILKPDKLATGGEDWLAWTWDNDKSEGVSVAPSNDMIFSGLKNNVIFVRVSDGTATTDASQSNALKKTEELTVADGRTFTLTNMYGDTMCGTWSNIVLTHLDYNRNQWTDSEGEIASSGNTDLLYTDFEIAFSDGEEEIFGENTDYKTGVVFELCAALNGGTFDESTHDYADMYPSDEANLKSAVKTAVKSNKTSGKYSYNGSKNRSFQLSNIPTSELTNRNRIEYSKSYKNAYKTDNEGNITSYTNSTYIMKATAYIVKGDTVTLSNSVFVCLNDIAAKKLAVNGVCVADTDD